MINIRPIQQRDDRYLQELIQSLLTRHHLNVPGTAYFDPELAHLSDYYQVNEQRQYFVAIDDQNHVLGGAGIAEYDEQKKIAELQKLYIDYQAQGQHLSYRLLDQAIQFAKEKGYQKIYLETHHVLTVAIHVYQRYGFTELEAPLNSGQHATMDRFFIKSI